VPCPGTSEFGYSLRAAKWPGSHLNTSDSSHALKYFCTPCPKPAASANCSGQMKVTSLAGWWLEKEVEGVQESRSQGGEIKHVFRAYKCDPGACRANNTCAYNRTGVVCGRCDPNHVLQVGVCVACANASPENMRMWRIVFYAVGGSMVGILWLMLCWAPVFGTSAQELFTKRLVR
jgi:hypothetical protein